MFSNNLFFRKQRSEGDDVANSSSVDPKSLDSVLSDARQQADQVKSFAGTGTGKPHTDSATPLESGLVGDDTDPALDVTIGSNAPALGPDAGGASEDNVADGKDNAVQQQAAIDDEEKDKKKKLKDHANTYPNGEYWYGALMEMLQNDDLDHFSRKTIGTVLYLAADLVTKKATKGNQDWMGLQGKIDLATNDLIGKATGSVKSAAEKGVTAASQLFGKFKARGTDTNAPADPRDGAKVAQASEVENENHKPSTPKTR